MVDDMINKKALLRIAVTGVTGRMGKEVISCIINTQKYDDLVVLGAAITRKNGDGCNMDVGKFMKSDCLGVTITDNLQLIKNDFDILIDFTSPEVTVEYLQFCVSHCKNIVIGTTGLERVHRSFIESAAKKIGIVYSSNFSVGMALILKLLKDITAIFQYDSHINIIEMHHNKKRDMPSGTALMIRDVILDVMKYRKDVNFDVLVHSIRTGNVVGEHSVLFSGVGECLEIAHKAFNRAIFAEGALRSAIWLGCSKVGLFNMNDVLEMN